MIRPIVLPSPSTGSLHLGPLELNAYGLMIALGVIAAVKLAGSRLERAGAGTRDDMSSIAVYAVIGGLVGARLYHVITDWSSFSNDLGRIPQVWKGGLGIPGGLVGGFAAGVWASKRRSVPVAPLLTAAAPASALAQAIGRWGNWFNQELFGRPTTLPWALEISPDKIPDGYAPGTTFHPTFLYESLWNLLLCVVLLAIDRRYQLRPGRLVAFYGAGYFTGRFWIEGLRIDRAHVLAGLRLNQWVSIVVVVACVAFLVLDHFRARPSVTDDPAAERIDHTRSLA